MNAYTAAEVGKLLRYPAPRVRAMYRAGTFPPPIDPTLSAVQWRWSPRVIEEYINGERAA
jgi:hypothetical protein